MFAVFARRTVAISRRYIAKQLKEKLPSPQNPIGRVARVLPQNIQAGKLVSKTSAVSHHAIQHSNDSHRQLLVAPANPVQQLIPKDTGFAGFHSRLFANEPHDFEHISEGVCHAFSHVEDDFEGLDKIPESLSIVMEEKPVFK